MKKIKVYILLTALIISSFLYFSTLYAQQTIKVYVNNKLIAFDASPRNIDNRVLVPVRGILESLDAEVNWDGTTRTVTTSKDGIDIRLKIGSRTAYVNQKPFVLDVPPQLIRDRTFIPVRFLAEGLGADVSWDGKNNAVYITYPSTSFSYKGISLGDSVSHVIETFGNPLRIDSSEYNFNWYVYHNNYRGYIQIGVKDRVVVALYGNDSGWDNHYNIDINTEKTIIEEKLKDPLTMITKGNVNYLLPGFRKGFEEYYLYSVNGDYITIFFDLHNHNKVTAIHMVSKIVEEAYIPSDYDTTTLRKAYEAQLFDLTNVARVKRGLTPLVRCSDADTVAYKHSYDMVKNQFFSHDNLQGLSPGDRLLKEGIDYYRAGENIAAGQQSAIYAFEGLMNSKGHREAILGDFENLGVGVAFGGPYNV
ncbi:stalk domain-containing protein [Alkaliphilus serpentinus]|nr:stalk domain-containing protein [Alkaliphilus serpentinus]